MDGKRTEGWYMTRITLAIGIVASAFVLIAGAKLFSSPLQLGHGPVLGMPSTCSKC